MRIGLYGMPTSGKTFVLNQIDFMEVCVGSQLLREYDPFFDQRDADGREQDRRDVARLMKAKDTFIMDGHYAFGDEIAFTEEEGEMYEVYLYLYADPVVLKRRMEESDKNRKYLKYDLDAWQKMEIEGLREYCHQKNKDFYILDCPEAGGLQDAEQVIRFIREILNGFSTVEEARKAADWLLSEITSSEIRLLDGDKTLLTVDTSHQVFGYKTHLYDNNFYTGFQTWKQFEEFNDYDCPDISEFPGPVHPFVRGLLGDSSVILTSGHPKIWKWIADQMDLPCVSGNWMAADAKFFITKFLQESGRTVLAAGDGMNDYYMLKQADQAWLITKPDGTISRSLAGKNMKGINYVYSAAE